MRPLITALGLIAAWEALVWLTGLPPYILPPPSRVAVVLVQRFDLLVEQGTPSSFVIVCIFYQKNSPHEKASYPSLGFLHELQD